MATSPIPPMLIELQLETAKITAQMAQLQNSFTSLGATVAKQNTFFERLKATAAGVFAGNVMMQGLQLLKTGISSAIADAREYEVVMAKTKAIIASTGGVAGVSAKHIQDQANALETVVTVDQNIIQQGENVIATFTQIRNAAGKGNDIFDQTTKAALDMSAVLKSDMPSAAMQLGKALNDPIRGMSLLQKVGVAFTAQQKEQITTLMNAGNVLGAQKIILAEVNREFGGAAKAAGDTFAGAVFRVKNAVQDFTRDLVTNLQPILLQIGKTIAFLYDNTLKPLFSWIIKNKEAFLLFVGIIVTAIAVFKTYQFIMGAVKAATILYTVATYLMKGVQLEAVVATEAQTGAMTLLNAVINANPIAKLIVLLSVLAAGFVLLWNHSETFRKAIVETMKGAVMSVGYLIKIFGVLVQTIMNVATGPLQLLLKGLALLKVPGAKEALDALRNPINAVGDFFDKAGNAVQDYADKLDALKNKKISLPGIGKSSTDSTVPTANDPTAVTAATIAKQKALADAISKIQKDFLKSMADEAQKKQQADIKAYEKYNEDLRKLNMKRDKDILDANKRAAKADAADQLAYEKQLIKNQTDYLDKRTQLLADYTKKEADIRKSAAEKVVQLEADAIDKQKGVIQKSVDQLKSAFASGLSFSIKDNYVGGAAGLVNMLRTQLTGARDLQKNAAALAGKGYTQSFIEQIVSAGPAIGNQMANSILNADAATQTELQSLYSSMTDITDNGMNDLATSMNSGAHLASQALMNEYNQVAIDLQKTLSTTNSELQASLAAANSDYQDSIAQALRDRNAANADAQTKLTEALAANAAVLKDDLASIQDDYNASLAEMGRTLQQDLIQNQKDYQDAITKIIDSTKTSLTDLGLSLDAAMLKILAFQALAAAAASANAAQSGGFSQIPLLPSTTANVGANIGIINANIASLGKAAGVGTTINTTINTTNLTNPSTVASTVTSAIKYGTVVSGGYSGIPVSYSTGGGKVAVAK